MTTEAKAPDEAEIEVMAIAVANVRRGCKPGEITTAKACAPLDFWAAEAALVALDAHRAEAKPARKKPARKPAAKKGGAK